jgi:chloramphenicol O-acetyltransferase
MEHTSRVTSTIDAYSETNEILEEELDLIIQFDFENKNDDFKIGYTLARHKDERIITLDTPFRYNTLSKAWENYLDQIAEANQGCQTANKKNARHEVYEGGKSGGNLIMSIPDTEIDI